MSNKTPIYKDWVLIGMFSMIVLWVVLTLLVNFTPLGKYII
jgi:hypothetical protein